MPHRLFEPLKLAHGPVMKNRFMLAPLTNQQSHPDGRLSDAEFHWLTRRARGGFGSTMTCASHVQALGQGFPGQLGCFSDDHVPGLTRLAEGIRAEGSHSIVQLHHAGMRSPEPLIGELPLCPSDDQETRARAMSGAEVAQLVGDFVRAAERVERAGFDGVELHGAHGYVLCQFLSPEINRRSDEYGGPFENRARIFFEIIDGIRQSCRRDFSLGVRLSAERFGLRVDEVRKLTQRLCEDAEIDYLDLSIWDVYKEPADEELRGRSLLWYFTELDRGKVALGAAGLIAAGRDTLHCMDSGLDFVVVGRSAILHHDFPEQVRSNPGFEPVALPAPRPHLRAQGLSDVFIDYLSHRPGFVAD